MSERPPRPIRSQHIVAPPNTPEELAEADERYQKNKKTAMYQIGCWTVVDVPLPLLAQYIAELPTEDQQDFHKELLERLPAGALDALNEAMQLRLGRGAA